MMSVLGLWVDPPAADVGPWPDCVSMLGLLLILDQMADSQI